MRYERIIDGHNVRYEQTYVDVGSGPYVEYEVGSWQIFVDDVPVTDQIEAESWRTRLLEAP